MAGRSGGRGQTSRYAKLEATRAAQRRSKRRRQLVVVVVLVVVALLGVGAAIRLVPTATPPRTSPSATAEASGVGLPPWPAPSDPEAGMQAAGLVSNPMEGAVQHFHAHLDILVDGKAVEVPANLGIDVRRGQIAELHTHDTSGILHVESGSSSLTFTLGQLFVEWGVKLDADDLGGLRAGGDEQLRAYVDGRQVQGDPADIQLANHQEIALVYGSDPSPQVPSTYDFAAAGL